MSTGKKLAPRPRISVTDDLIDLAVRRDSGHCMIADAVKRAIPGARSVAVDLQSIRWTDPEKGVRYIFLTPRVAQIALVDFDQERRPPPFSFNLRSPMIIKVQLKKKTKDDVRLPRTATLVSNTDPGSKTQRSVPLRVGGTAPPHAALSNKVSTRGSGRRRQFGLRALER